MSYFIFPDSCELLVLVIYIILSTRVRVLFLRTFTRSILRLRTVVRVLVLSMHTVRPYWVLSTQCSVSKLRRTQYSYSYWVPLLRYKHCSTPIAVQKVIGAYTILEYSYWFTSILPVREWPRGVTRYTTKLFLFIYHTQSSVRYFIFYPVELQYFLYERVLVRVQVPVLSTYIITRKPIQ